MPPDQVAAAGKWRIRKEHGYWVLRRRGEWRLTTSYWWLAMWCATRDRRVIPAGHAGAMELARLAGY